MPFNAEERFVFVFFFDLALVELGSNLVGPRDWSSGPGQPFACLRL